MDDFEPQPNSEQLLAELKELRKRQIDDLRWSAQDRARLLQLEQTLKPPTKPTVEQKAALRRQSEAGTAAVSGGPLRPNLTADEIKAIVEVLDVNNGDIPLTSLAFYHILNLARGIGEQ